MTRRPQPETHSFPCTFKRETDNAVLVVHHESGEELWIPFSQVHEMHRDAKGEGSITVTAWIARQKGLL